MSKKVDKSQNPEFSADRPISKPSEDKFQRYNFSKRIAQTIIERKENECLVLGVYGAWGEGKTSVINFIENELASNKDFITTKFNPWRYGDENALLTQFFNQFAAELGKSLKEGKEEFGKFLQDYGKFLNVDIFGINLGEAAEKAGGKMSKISIEELKSRLEKIIVESKKKIVVFIDDIDRLDKAEIHSVFRLVKLNADFKNTTYVLSFDERMVAISIGDRFGGGDEVAGRNFLEKIIQVPLQIPAAQPSDLQDFCFQLLNQVIDSNKIDLTKEDNDRFVINFLNNILFRLTTPRLAVRYSNSISFSVPLLNGEVNITDLLLIEAVKTFYPDHYNFIKNNPTFFIEAYDDYRGEKRHDKVKEFNARLDEVDKNFTMSEKSRIQDLLTSLFPLLKSAFGNYAFSDHSYKDWVKNKRVVSDRYFGKYFSYSTLKGDISDATFNALMADSHAETPENISLKFSSILDETKPTNFLQKVRMVEKEYDWHILSKMALAISLISEKFPEDKLFTLFDMMSPFRQASFFISQVIRNHNSPKEQLTLAKTILTSADNFKFANEVYFSITTGRKNNDSPFNGKQIKELQKTMIDRMLKESESSNIFEKFSYASRDYFVGWAKNQKTKADKYVKDILKKDAKKVTVIIKSFGPFIRSSSHPEAYFTDFTEVHYKRLISVISKELLHKTIIKCYKKSELDITKIEWVGDHGISTEINLIRQFEHWYNLP